MGPSHDSGRECETGEMIAGQAVVAGGDAAPGLELAPHALDHVPALVGLAVEREREGPGGQRRKDRPDLSLRQPSAQGHGIAGLVGDRALGPGPPLKERNGHVDVGPVARCQGKGDRSALRIGRAMDFARRPPAREADRFRPGPPVVVCAERGAFTCVLSSDNSPGMEPAAAILSNMRCQMPRRDHRGNRW